MTNAIVPLRDQHNRQRTDCARVSPGAQVRWHRIALPPRWPLVTPASGCCGLNEKTAAPTAKGKSE
jgi:hypothetical protein